MIAFGERRVSLAGDWRPGEPVRQGTLDGDRDRGAGPADPQRPSRSAMPAPMPYAHVYTAREAQLAALMPEKAAADTGKFLLCPMPGLVKALFVSASARRSRPASRSPWSRR